MQITFSSTDRRNIGTDVESSGGSGNQMDEENGVLVCPVCNEKFENTPENTRILAVHVDDHFVEDLNCPICNVSYNVRDQRQYEIHVNVSRPYFLLCYLLF